MHNEDPLFGQDRILFKCKQLRLLQTKAGRQKGHQGADEPQPSWSKLAWIMPISVLKEYDFVAAVGDDAALALDLAKEATSVGLAQGIMEPAS